MLDLLLPTLTVLTFVQLLINYDMSSFHVDMSFFLSIAAVNLSLTAVANALRVGDHLL